MVYTRSSDRIGGARVTVLDGPNAGASVVADNDGNYRFDSLIIANANLNASKEGYFDNRGGTFINGVNTLDFRLDAEPAAQGSITITARRITGGGGSIPQEWRFEATEGYSTYEWDFGNGERRTTSTPSRQFLYTRAGKVTVTVTGRNGNNSNTGTLTVDLDSSANTVP